MKCFLGICSFLEEISSLSHSIFLYVFALIAEEGFLFFSFFFLKRAFLSLLATLWNSAFKWVYLSFSPLPFASFLFSAICKASSDSHFAFLHFFFLGMVLIPASCTMSQTSVSNSGVRKTVTVVTKEELREGAGLGVNLILGMLSWTARQGSEGDAPLCTEGSWQPQREGATAMGELKDRLTDERAEAQRGSGSFEEFLRS